MDEHVTVFFKIMDRGFHLHVPADQEAYYVRAKEIFRRMVEKHKSKGHDEMEAMALTSIDSIVSLQRNYDQLEKQKQQLANKISLWDEKVEKSLKGLN